MHMLLCMPRIANTDATSFDRLQRGVLQPAPDEEKERLVGQRQPDSRSAENRCNLQLGDFMWMGIMPCRPPTFQVLMVAM